MKILRLLKGRKKEILPKTDSVEYSEEVIVEKTDRSPADILAMRIGQSILKDGMAVVSSQEVGNNHVRYRVKIFISKRRK